MRLFKYWSKWSPCSRAIWSIAGATVDLSTYIVIYNQTNKQINKTLLNPMCPFSFFLVSFISKSLTVIFYICFFQPFPYLSFKIFSSEYSNQDAFSEIVIVKNQQIYCISLSLSLLFESFLLWTLFLVPFMIDFRISWLFFLCLPDYIISQPPLLAPLLLSDLRTRFCFFFSSFLLLRSSYPVTWFSLPHMY